MKTIKSIIAVTLAMVLLLTVGLVGVSAEKTVDFNNTTYTDYTYWGTDENKKAVPMKSVYAPELQVDIADLGFDFSTLSLEQTCYDTEGNLHLLESSTGSIIVFDKNYKLKKIIKEVRHGKETFDLVGAKGIFIDKNGMYICDTANARVLFCVNEEVKEIILEPKASIIPSDFKFTPTRFVTDERGYGYLLSDGCYYGLLVFSAQRDFIGFFGANKVKSTLGEAIGGWITSLFETQSKHEGTVKKLPYLLADICISKDGYICGVNSEKTGQLRMFAPTGDNILKYNSQFSNGSGDDFNFADSPNVFINLTDIWLNSIKQSFCAVTSDDEGFIYALDLTQGRIYMYDESCNIISVFGGGRKQGNQVGTFVSPISIDVYEDDLAVVDYVNKNITVFGLTEYGKTLKTAQRFTLEGDYDEAKEHWDSVYAQDKNCQLAYIGLAKYYLSKGDNKKAMEFAHGGNDKVTYSQGYGNVLNSFLRNHLWWIVLLITVIALAVFIILRQLKKKGKVLKLNPKLETCLKFLLQPIESLNNIKNYGRGSVVIATVILVLFYVASISQKLFVSFMYNRVDLSDFNSIYTLLGSVGLLLLYVVVNWAACVLFEGKGKGKEIYCASCYCLIPLILSSFLYTILSYIVIPSTNSGLSLLTTVFTGLFIIYLLLSITVIHDFSFFKAIGMLLVIVVGIGIVIFVLFAMLTLGQDLLSFIIGIFREATLR